MKIEEKIAELRKKRLPIPARPIGTRIIIPTIHVDEKTESGIIKPDSAVEEEKKRSQIITVALAVGNATKEVKTGDILYLTPNTPYVEFVLGGQKLAVIDEYDVMLARD